MTIILNKEEFTIQAQKLMEGIEKGAVFIYGTDTIYGLGCNALNAEAVKRVRMIKGRKDQPFSIIAPSKEWIFANCEVDVRAQEWINKLPGPYTLILKLRKKNAVAKEVIPASDSVGVRIPKHWFSDVVEALEFPVVTTSVNKADKAYMTSVEDLDTSIKGAVDFIIDEGEIKGFPSKIVHLEKEEVEVTDRSKTPYSKH